MAGNICKHNQHGFCRHGDRCRHRHVNENCLDSNCQDETCLLRHPYKCRYFYLYGNCKFGDSCAYVHEENEDKVRIQILEEKLSMFEGKVVQLEKKLDAFMCMENTGGDSVNFVTDATDDIKENDEQKNNSCHSQLCDFESNHQNDLVIHMEKKHKKEMFSPKFDGKAINDTKTRKILKFLMILRVSVVHVVQYQKMMKFLLRRTNTPKNLKLCKKKLIMSQNMWRMLEKLQKRELIL